MTDAPAPRFITNSELQTFKDCRRRWWLQYYRGLQPIREKKTGPAALGSLVHDALEVGYDPTKSETFSEAIRRISVENLAKIDPDAHEDEVKKITDDHELATLMVEGYEEWLEETGADANYEVIAPEQKVDVPFFTDPHGRVYRLLAKLDLRVRDIQTGARHFLDHKTVANLTDFPKIAYMSEQMLHYALILRLHDPENYATGATFNMLRKVKRTARSKPPFYERHSVTFNDEYLRSYWSRTYNVVQDLARLTDQLDRMPDDLHQQALTAYPSPSRDCTWKCDFRNTCTMHDDGSDAEGMIPRLYEKRDPLARYNDETEATDV